MKRGLGEAAKDEDLLGMFSVMKRAMIQSLKCVKEEKNFMPGHSKESEEDMLEGDKSEDDVNDAGDEIHARP